MLNKYNYVFLLASERSGSNLLTRMMDRHSLVAAPPPAHYIRLLLDHRHRYGDFTRPASWKQLLADTVRLSQTALSPWPTKLSSESLETATIAGDLAGLVRHIFQLQASSSSACTIFVKENQLYRHQAFIERNFPGATFVYLVRDPRDMALSWKKAHNLRGGVVRASNTWSYDQAAFCSWYQCLAQERRAVGIRYEDLIAEPAKVLTDILDLLALAYEPAMLRPGDPASKEIANATLEWRNVNRPVMADNKGMYKLELTSDEIAYIEHKCAAIMSAFGYLPVAENPGGIDPSLHRRVEQAEPHDKPGFLDQPSTSRERQLARQAVLTQIMQRNERLF